MADELGEWLLTQLAEDERTAVAVTKERRSWHYSDSGSVYVTDSNEYVAVGPWGCDVNEEDGRHIARWDPARVLNDCIAKRQIVDIHAGPHSCGFSDYDNDDPCPTLRMLALPYADRSGYRAEWAPHPIPPSTVA